MAGKILTRVGSAGKRFVRPVVGTGRTTITIQ